MQRTKCVQTRRPVCGEDLLFFFFNAPAATAISTLSLHDALPISPDGAVSGGCGSTSRKRLPSSPKRCSKGPDRKSTRLNSSHGSISYAGFSLKKKIETGLVWVGSDTNHHCLEVALAYELP